MLKRAVLCEHTHTHTHTHTHITIKKGGYKA